ncbi:OmpP1/FadL family transporter [Pseudomonas vancouverensis]|uniref:Transporter n=1 Tax=Pseudomonas vancouverensis TaxID=95300 RepID=A0A1H2PDT3_PSEVA|nr:outer membrane protein transport protein [Pseudomonas vancouverensis]KAB0493640.1 transporter [Pseudomonas vancouverensis]TDB67783.1 transporter [Pseudomonas vancouverensis]SDV15465.1 long-chain fatty acid transport protein [Pseudomonas vancouverensis]
MTVHEKNVPHARKVPQWLTLLGVLGCTTLPHSAWAGGILLYEAGQEGAGLANAGAAVLATDPSVLMNNPAGISQLKGTQVNVDGQLMLGDITFSRDSNNTFSGGNGGNPLPYFPGTSFFVSHQVDDRNSIGFGMYGNFGLSLDYDDDWAGRYFTQESAIVGVSFQPTYAFKVTDDLSIGGGPRFMYGYYRTEVAVNNNVLGLGNAPDGQLRYKDGDWGTGYNLGILYRLNERTQLGLAYTSKIDLKFKDSPELKHITNPLLNVALNRLDVDQLKVDMTVPQTVLASASYRLDDHWTLLGSLNWQDWSEFGKIGVEVDTNNAGTSTSVDRSYKDTYHVSIGAQNQIDNKWRWNVGVAYDTSAVDDKDRTVDNPMDSAWRFATGVNYALEKDLDLHMSYTLIYMGDMDDQQTKARSGDTVSGTYRNSMIHVFGGGAVWRF